MIKSSFRTPGADRLPVGIQVAMVRQRWPPIPPTAVDLSIVIGCVSRPATGPQAPGKRRWRRRLKNDPATPDSKFPTPISCTRRALRKGYCRSPTVNHATDNTRKLDLNMPLTSRNILVEMVARAGIEPATFRFSDGRAADVGSSGLVTPGRSEPNQTTWIS